MSECCRSTSCPQATEAQAWFEEMIGNCYAYAKAAQEQGRPIVGIMCEYTPRELILAAGGVPVCLCGGSAATISAAERDLPTNLCPLVKSTYGYHVLESNPFLEMADLVIAETTCDGKKKMFELLAQTRPTYQLELPQKQDEKEARTHWLLELGKLKRELETHFHTRITTKKLQQAIRTMNTERALRRQLAGLMKQEAPPLTGRELLAFKSSISGIAEDFAHYQSAYDTLASQTRPELAERVRVLLTGVPTVYGAERVVELIEDHGGLIVCQENCTGVKPILTDIEETAVDPMAAIAEKYFGLHCSVMTPNRRRLEVLRQLAQEYRPDCVIELIWQACLTYDIESYFVKRMVEEELKVPYLRIETDYSTSDSARLGTRMEALYETVRGRRVS